MHFLRVVGLAATTAAVLATVGDLLLLSAATDVASPSEANGSHDRDLIIGHYLGVLFIPLYALGYWHVARGLRSASVRASQWLFYLGAYSAAIGAAVHGVTAVIIRATPSAARTGTNPFAVLTPFGVYLLPLWLALGALALVISLLHLRLVRSRHSRYPLWFGFCNPTFLALAVALASLPFPRLAMYAIPAAPNLAHIAYFGLSTVLLWKIVRV